MTTSVRGVAAVYGLGLFSNVCRNRCRASRDSSHHGIFSTVPVVERYPSAVGRGAGSAL